MRFFMNGVSKTIASLALFCALSFCGACGPSTAFNLPADFVALSDGDLEWRDYDWKAVNTEGAVVVLRERDNDQGGSLEFWVKALRQEIIEGRGYELIDTTELETRNMKGTQLNFQADHAGTAYRYNIAVFVADGGEKIVTVETATRLEDWESHRASLEEIVASARFD